MPGSVATNFNGHEPSKRGCLEDSARRILGELVLDLLNMKSKDIAEQNRGKT